LISVFGIPSLWPLSLFFSLPFVTFFIPSSSLHIPDLET
jgi:hypothetical protein